MEDGTTKFFFEKDNNNRTKTGTSGQKPKQASTNSSSTRLKLLEQKFDHLVETLGDKSEAFKYNGGLVAGAIAVVIGFGYFLTQMYSEYNNQIRETQRDYYEKLLEMEGSNKNILLDNQKISICSKFNEYWQYKNCLLNK
jgi:hypothetical protein